MERGIRGTARRRRIASLGFVWIAAACGSDEQLGATGPLDADATVGADGMADASTARGGAGTGGAAPADASSAPDARPASGGAGSGADAAPVQEASTAPDGRADGRAFGDAGDAGSDASKPVAVCGDGVVTAPEMCEPDEPFCQSDCVYPQGHVFWTDTLVGFVNSVGTTNAAGKAVAFDPEGAPLAAVVRGGSAPIDGAGTWIKKYTRQGAEAWYKRWYNSSLVLVYGEAMTALSDGSPLIAGSAFPDLAFVGTMAGNGTVGWDWTLATDGGFSDVTTLRDGSIVASGFLRRSPDQVVGWLLKLASSGSRDWLIEVPSSLEGKDASAAATDYFREVEELHDGRVVTLACCVPGGAYYLRAYETDSSVAWTTALPALTGSTFYGGLVVDRNGDVVIASRSRTNLGLAKYDARGREIWTKEQSAAEVASADPTAVVATPQGRYVVGGGLRVGTRQDLFYGAFDEQGNPIWHQTVSALGSSPTASIVDLAVDKRGVVLAGGTVTRSDGVGLGWVRMFAP